MSFLARSVMPRAAAVARTAQAPRLAAVARPFSTSRIAMAGSGSGPPILQGEGAKAGEVPTDENQATGLERFELLGKLQGVDVFDMKPLQSDRIGTMKDPIVVQSLVSERRGSNG